MGKRIIVFGADGFLGFSLVKTLCLRGDIVLGIDNFTRRILVTKVGSDSVIPIFPMCQREKVLGGLGFNFSFIEGDLTDFHFVYNAIKEFKPDTIVHLGEIPSAVYSMRGIKEAVHTQVNNVTSTLNALFSIKEINKDISFIKLGTLGEWGCPNIEIPEGFFEIEYKGRKDILPFPRQSMSLYHKSKEHSSTNMLLLTKIWGLNITDIMQGVVYGTQIEEEISYPKLATRFDVCDFGTVIHRFCAQAVIEHPLTVYGSGTQRRGFLSLKDSMQCLTLLLDNPSKGYRVVNQLAEIYEINKLAEVVQTEAYRFDLEVEIKNFTNPRIEAENHYYEVETKVLPALGYKPLANLETEIRSIINDLLPHKDRIKSLEHVLVPDVFWSGEKKKAGVI